jgi:hypothetical protein
VPRREERARVADDLGNAGAFLMDDAETSRQLAALLSLVDPERIGKLRADAERALANPWWLPYQVHPPLGESGRVRVVRRETTIDDAVLINLNPRNEILRGFRAYPGTWTYLLLDGETWMSDTPDEINDHMPFILAAEGNVLVTGLGLGVVVQALLRKPTVRRLDVVEKNPDVVCLIAPSFEKDERFHVHVADAWSWTPPPSVEYDWAWHDIWQNLDADNIPEFERIRGRYKPHARRQACWAEDYVREFARIQRRLRAQPQTAQTAAHARRAMQRLNEARHRPPTIPEAARRFWRS